MRHQGEISKGMHTHLSIVFIVASDNGTTVWMQQLQFLILLITSKLDVRCVVYMDIYAELSLESLHVVHVYVLSVL